MNTQAIDTAQIDPVTKYLEDQIGWYDKKSSGAQRTFKRIKIVEIVSAALIPFLSAVNLPRVTLITSALGVLITILEGMLHLNQYEQNWIGYRATCESLRHEQFLYLGHAAPYAGSQDPRDLLAERVESIVFQENAKWASMRKPNTTSA